MRAGDVVAVHPDLGNCTFANWFLCLGNNELETINEDYIKCPNMMKLPLANTQAMAVAIYPQLHKGQVTNEYLRELVILAPCNKEVSLINAMVLSYLLGAQVDFFSADFAEDMEVANTYLSKFLNTLEVNGMPSHKLSFKIGAPMMLLRNLDPSAGLCNGTRLIVRCFMMRVIEAEIITGKGVSNVAFIPRIKFITDNSDLPFTFARKQFPLRLAYAMIINKSQGQTLSHVGLHLVDDVFSHGQLYVAFSRAKALTNVKVQLLDTVHGRIGLMRNVVYEEAFL
jgi:ATP-dependent DNA helicase PIF1